MEKRQFISVLGVFAIVVICGIALLGNEVSARKQTKFIHVSNGNVVDKNGRIYLIKGMALGNEIWSNPSTPSKTHHTEDTYRELSKLGFNSVRFYLNYRLFEDDSKPYTYKETGFEWIDTNLKWAKKYGIKLILNMHYPQGGYQSQGNGMELWTDRNNQKRLIALWKEIAKRYQNETEIIGYGLINEPYVPEKKDVKSTIGQCQKLMQEITDAIRTVDQNHIVFVEKVNACKNLETGETDWNKYKDEREFLIDDKNAVYEFHCYEPYSFTHQDTDWAGTAGNISYYPSKEIMVGNMIKSWAGFMPGDKTGKEENGWSYFQSQKVSATDHYNIGNVVMQAANLGVNGTAYFDDIVVTEFDSKGNKTQDIYIEGYDHQMEANLWSKDGSGKYLYSLKEGHKSKGCISITGTRDDANISIKQFLLREGYSYQISGWVKTEGANANCTARPRIDFSLGEDIYQFNKKYLRNYIKECLAFASKHKVPCYLGEFGVVSNAFTMKRGGKQWVSDLIDICMEYDLGFNYHTYHEESFGLYMNQPSRLPANRNDELARLFKKKLVY